MNADTFRRRLLAWKQLEEERGHSWTVRALEHQSGITRALWSVWLSGKGKYRSQQMPSAEQWEQLRLNMGISWYIAFEDAYAGVKELEIPNRTCPICRSEFRARGHQLYDSRFCRFVAACQRDDDRRKSPAAALRAV